VSDISLTVPGVPAPQGSLIRPDNPATRPWKQAIAWEARAALGHFDLITGPVEIIARLYFPRPKSHFGTGRNASVLKATAPSFHQSKPDTDKLQRAIGDSLTGVLLRDDSQIVHWDVWKFYGNPPRAELELHLLTESATLAPRLPEGTPA
jgi:Holliday junction resolvase RusA-like endonuclease